MLSYRSDSFPPSVVSYSEGKSVARSPDSVYECKESFLYIDMERLMLIYPLLSQSIFDNIYSD